MLGQILSGTADGWTVLKVVAVLVPVVLVLWIILTVTALHRRDVYFWSLGSTWVSVIVCPISLVLASSSTLNRVGASRCHTQDTHLPLAHTPCSRRELSTRNMRSEQDPRTDCCTRCPCGPYLKSCVGP